MNANLNAFLILIRTGEGTLGENGYRTLYGGGLFDSFADHPRIKVKAGKWTSTAAGAYQILAKTWDGLVAMQPDVFTDFTPTRQDEAAKALIKGRGAFADVLAGRFKTAILKCNKEWASLPLSPYGQPTLTLDKAFLILTNAGGIFADTPHPAPTPMEDKPVAPFLLAAIPALIQALPDFANIFKSKDVAERNVEAVSKAATIIMDSVGATNVQEAVEKVTTDPEMATVANAAVRASKADIMDIVERLNAMEQGNIKSAREYNTAEKPLIGHWKFWHILALVVVIAALAAMGYIIGTSKDIAERTMVLQVLLLGGFAIVMQFVFGSSDGSKTKDLLRDK
jgi:muramidase (phage lysozyme)